MPETMLMALCDFLPKRYRLAMNKGRFKAFYLTGNRCFRGSRANRREKT